MKDSVKIFLFLFVMALTIFLLKPWKTSDQLVGDESSSRQVGQSSSDKASKGGGRSPASVGNPGEASGLSIRE